MPTCQNSRRRFRLRPPLRFEGVLKALPRRLLKGQNGDSPSARLRPASRAHGLAQASGLFCLEALFEEGLSFAEIRFARRERLQGDSQDEQASRGRLVFKVAGTPRRESETRALCPARKSSRNRAREKGNGFLRVVNDIRVLRLPVALGKDLPAELQHPSRPLVENEGHR